SVVLDPSRVAAQVVSGIGFIGAGTILFQKQGGTIRGITTAAGLWTVAAIGLATGGGLYFAAGTTTIIAIIILWALQPLEYTFLKKYKQSTLRIVTNIDKNNEALLNKLFNETELKIHNFTFNRVDDTFVFQLKLDNMVNEVKLDAIIDELRKDVSIKEITLM
ncbi:MAG: MgtC/SapB family protein, partial [Chitinophagales bacterium]|nr:MgtC/SapB family protein [Chitinophagales bacterium]